MLEVFRQFAIEYSNEEKVTLPQDYTFDNPIFKRSVYDERDILSFEYINNGNSFFFNYCF